MSIPMSNATIIAVRPPPLVNSSGGQTQNEPVSTRIRCVVEELSIKQRYELPQTLQDASESILVQRSEGDALVTEAQVTYRIDGEDEVTRQVLFRDGEMKHGGLSYVEIYCKGI